MRIAIYGVGYVGITSAACLVRDGHDVIGVDISERKVELINAGRSPIYEPGVEDLLSAGVLAGRLSAQTELHDLSDVDVAIVCVGTPSGIDGSHDMRYIAEVSHHIARAAISTTPRAKPLTVVYRSTMRPGSVERLIEPIFRRYHENLADVIELVYNPEFLREATALKDYWAPPKIVAGTRDGRPSAALDQMYAGIDAPRFNVGYREAEITKFVDNSFHALKVAFANEIGRICLREQVSARTVHEIFVSDTKLNISPYYLRPGGAFGGSCLPKDVRALTFLANETGAETFLIDSILRSNEAHKRFVFELATLGLKPGARVLLNGLAFKANSDDLRESPYVDLARRVLNGGFDLYIWDPQIEPSALLGHNLGYSFAHLPELNGLLVRDIDMLESLDIAAILDARGDAHALPLRDVPVVSVNVIP
ncbi:nucleotide sugar dehydrogenase [Sphingomonas hengshuiensis]|uniref:UDP-glucose 6-dehydrogenase n=1 Tax=Sphingomonas hengshuiensis TaxID=1609977 RepID=A0A7U4JBQ9_9SPHN|nr:nucleotide sugar dehydrogenase [Sphingomonas hengshuiensis]AJP73900.1 GDP-mannose dehydrogenase [Sphingomonas hengshuiensis]